MNKNIFLIYFFSCSFFCLNGLSAQHVIKAVFDNDPKSVTRDVSYMCEGIIDNNFMKFISIPELSDGELTFDLSNYKSTDNILFKLVNDSNNDVYGMRLTGGVVTIEEPSHPSGLQKGDYTIDDDFKIVRCSNYIFFYHGGYLVHSIELPDNNFKINGEVTVVNAVAVEADLEFHSL